MKTILVSGCAGFLGTNLCKRLLEEGNMVIGFDNFITGSLKNVIELKKYPKFNFQQQDICEKMTWLDFVKIDQIYHLASIASPEYYVDNPFMTILSNTVGTSNLLDLAVMHNASFLFTSTSEVYGDPEQHPQKETYRGNVNTYGPRSCYDEAKRLGETIVYEYKRIHQVDTKIVRIFNTYGPHMNLNDKRVVIEFIKNALQGRPLEIMGDGSQTRSFCYVDDLVEGLIRMMNSDKEGPTNLGNDKTEMTVKELADFILELTTRSGKVIHKEKMKDDPTVRRPDLTKAFEELGFQPKISLEEGIRKTIEYVKQELELWEE